MGLGVAMEQVWWQREYGVLVASNVLIKALVCVPVENFQLVKQP